MGTWATPNRYMRLQEGIIDLEGRFGFIQRQTYGRRFGLLFDRLMSSTKQTYFLRVITFQSFSN